jgi:AcrR family transcriptional regulator
MMMNNTACHGPVPGGRYRPAVSEPAAAPPRRGRPALTAQRRAQILDAFVALVAERGLEAVSLDDVAREAGVQRSVIRHFVGNRSDLIRGAIEVLSERYARKILAEVGVRLSVGRMIRLLFSDRWNDDMAVEDRAFDELLREATRDDDTKRRIKEMYDLLIAALAEGIVRERPGVARRAADDCAYAIVCLAEHNVAMRALGFPRSSAQAAARAARELVARLEPSP